MPVTLLFLHGWGFGSEIWDAVAEGLGDLPHAFSERGYFGPPSAPRPDAPVIAVTHSFGTMRLLAYPPPQCRAIVAVNGFDRFAATDGFPGVPGRVVDRMAARFDKEPERTLSDFRVRCGANAPAGEIAGGALASDLAALRQDDCRDRATTFAGPIVSLQGTDDPLLSPAMRDAVFGGAPHVERLTVPGGGHLLPLSHPEVCIRHVRTLAGHFA